MCVWWQCLVLSAHYMQLGLDQMHHLNDVSYSGFIVWFVFSVSSILYIDWFVDFVLKGYILYNIIVAESIVRSTQLCLALFATLFLFLDLLFVKAGCDCQAEPTKVVFKFTAKHRASLMINRSALAHIPRN